MTPRRNPPYRSAVAAVLGLAAASAAAAPADGVLDPTFADEGKATIGFDIAASSPLDLALDAVTDSFGRIYLVGVVNTDLGQRIGITRLRRNGTLDTNYGPDDVGLVVAPEQAGFSLTGVSAAIDAQGYLLVGGTVTTAGNDDFAVCRFDVDGSLAAFPNGFQCVKVAFDLTGQQGTKSDVLRDIAVQPDGKIVLVGSANFNSTITRLAVARLDTNGDLDAEFNSGLGMTSYTPPNSLVSRLHSVAIASNGKIVAAGDVRLQGRTDTDLLLVRMESDGHLDTEFATDGIAVLAPVEAARDQTIRKIALGPDQPDQPIVAVGSIETGIGSGLHDGLVARIDPDGTPTTGFGTGATGFRIDATGNDLAFADLALEPNGSILAAGTIRANANPATTTDYYVTRLRADGSTDHDAFNPPSGFSLIDIAGSNDTLNAMALQSARIVVAGASLTSAGPPANLDFSAAGLLRDRIFADGMD
jgi:uncharacterized delta-60 repeat protein